MKKTTHEEIDQLFSAILMLKSVEECRKFFRDLLTEKEIDEFAKRWRVAQMLEEGVSYSTIESKTGFSSRTIARVHRWLTHGKGGYGLVIRRLRGR
ncbi:MAG: hypothetical protein HY562_00595 [Ignavibacteriales bacterium]|nr:hypothetical protein [Ignavibacteriales bacterium]